MESHAHSPQISRLRLTDLPQSDNSLHCLPLESTRRSAMRDLLKSTVRWSERSALGFIPFVNERDDMGRLISASPKATSITAPVSPLHSSQQVAKKSDVNHSPRLLKKTLQSTPALGTYPIDLQWLKKSFRSPQSFRRKTMKNATVPSCSPPPPTPKRGLQTHKSQPAFRRKREMGGRDEDYGREWEELRVKNKFGALKLHGDPMELKAILAFRQHLAVRDQILVRFRALTRPLTKKVRYGNS